MKRLRVGVLVTGLATCLAVAADAAGAEPALLRAVKVRDHQAVRTLLQQGQDARAASPDGTTALHWAARSGDRASADLLIRAGADVNARNRYGVTPLALAVRADSEEVVRSLLASGARVRTADEGLPERQTLLMHAARTGNLATLRALIGAGADVNAREERTGTTAAIWAAVANRGEAVRLLAEAGADLNVASRLTSYPHTANGVGLSGLEDGVSYVGQTVLPKGGWTAPMFAAREGAVDALTALADAGADLNAQDPEGTPALIIAIINGHYEAARVLLQKGADPNVADIKGMTALYAAVDMHTIPTTFGRPDPPSMVIAGSVGAVRMLLAAGADPNLALKGPVLKRVYNPGDPRLGEGATPFMRAARGGDLELMHILVEAGADPRATQTSGITPIMLAAGAGSGRGSDNNPDHVTEAKAIAVITYCLELGLDINGVAANGDTAAHLASTSNLGSPSVIRFLHAHGARFDVRNKAGRTPLEAVLRAREVSDDTVAVLREITGETTAGAPAGSPGGNAEPRDRQ